MKLIRFFLHAGAFLLMLFFLQSCVKEGEAWELNFVSDHPIKGKYPEYVMEIAIPFHANCGKDVLLKPINFIRSDINNKVLKTNAWHFEERGDNLTVELSKEWLKQYFKDSLVPTYVQQPKGNRNFDLKDFIIKKKNKGFILIYSETSDLTEYEGVPVFQDAASIKKTIEEIVCNNPETPYKRIFVIINPPLPGDIGGGERGPEPGPKPDTIGINGPKGGSDEGGDEGPPPIAAVYKYIGGLKNGKPHGTGTMVFLKDGYAPVPKYSTEQIPVKKGQQLTGRFINGKFVSGDLLDENGNKIKSIYIGN